MLAAIVSVAIASFVVWPRADFVTLRRLPAGPSPLLAPDAPKASSPKVPLEHFRAQLTELKQGGRRNHVRIALFGDSHTQGGAFGDGLRSAFAQRFAAGGPGFVHLGSPNHPHGGVIAKTRGVWTFEPSQPSSTTPRSAAATSLGGVNSRAKPKASLSLKARAGLSLLWDVCARASPPSTIRLGGRQFAVGPAATHMMLRSSELAIEVDSGSVAFCGAIGESDPHETPGIVVDAMGLNGARYATFLSWDEQTFSAELRRRSPNLVVFEYGTNEASDEPPDVDMLLAQARDSIARVRAVVPECDCVLLGPTDRRNRGAAIESISRGLERVAAQNACAFWNTVEKMGGIGSIADWAERGLALDDGIHLTPAGYSKLAAELVVDLLGPS